MDDMIITGVVPAHRLSTLKSLILGYDHFNVEVIWVDKLGGAQTPKTLLFKCTFLQRLKALISGKVQISCRVAANPCINGVLVTAAPESAKVAATRGHFRLEE